jgi:hypothetical protein
MEDLFFLRNIVGVKLDPFHPIKKKKMEKNGEKMSIRIAFNNNDNKSSSGG